MSVRYKVSTSLSSRRVARIITVDPTNRKIEGQLKDGGLIQISLFDVPPFFVWPQQDEFWIVRQDGNYWKLYNKFDDNDETKVSSLNPGEAKVAAETIRTPSGKKLVTIGDSDHNWTNLELINGWQDVSTLNESDAGYIYSKQNIDEEYLADLSPLSYQYNDLTKTVYFRGIIYHPLEGSEESPDLNNPEFAIMDLSSALGISVVNGEIYKPEKSILGLAGSVVFKSNGRLALANSNISGEQNLIIYGFSIQLDSATDSSTSR